MYYFLMHKDTKVALCKEGKTVEIYEEKLIPKGAVKEDKQYDIKNWENERKIPEKRTNFRKIKNNLEKLNINIENAHHYNYGLSLTDCYWFYNTDYSFLTIKIMLKMKILDKKIPLWKDINYYDKKFEFGLLEKILHNKEIVFEDIYTPDITTNGCTQKYWVVRNKNFILVKQNDAIQNYVAEKELLASFVAYMLNECRIESKKKEIATASYQFEKGRDVTQNCCYSEIFTTKDESLVSYKMLSSNLSEKSKQKKMEKFIKDNPNIRNLQDFFDFIIVLDFLTENIRDESDIGFIYNNNTGSILKPAPIYGNTNCFEYMKKDFTRANHKLYSSDHINVFGMNEEEQCKYIAENIKWFMPDMLYRKSDMLMEFLVNIDMVGMPREYRDHIADWIKYKIVMIANLKRQIAIAEEANKDEQDSSQRVNSDGEIVNEDEDEDY